MSLSNLLPYLLPDVGVRFGMLLVGLHIFEILNPVDLTCSTFRANPMVVLVTIEEVGGVET